MPTVQPPKPLRLRIPFSHVGACRVLIGAGVLRTLPQVLRSCAPGHRLFVLTDSRVKSLHAGRLVGALRRAGWKPHLLVVRAGEASKSRAMKARLEDRMLALGAGRDAVLVTLGGGMVSDLGGFVAATYLRGIPWVAVPTTLLAMVDAALGGKTGVDHPLGKNLIGAFHPPVAALADLRLLRSLPEREFRAGLAEVVKAGVIGDAALFRRLERAPEAVLSRRPAALAPLVLAACRVKARIVAQDERESGRRAVLNFGHTLGHALEHLSHYALRHGEAVSLGMVLEARAAAHAGVMKGSDAERLEKILRRLGLPTTGARRYGLGRLLSTARRDKKARGGIIRYALPRRIGQMASASGQFTMPLAPFFLQAAVRWEGSEAGALAHRRMARRDARPRKRHR